MSHSIGRRHFLRLLSASATIPLLLAGHIKVLANNNVDNTKQLFAQALEKDTRLAGFKGVSVPTLSHQNLPSIGKIPAQLYGTFYRNGPAKHEFHERRYHHWFDGDGMIQTFQLSATGISHQGRLIETQKYKNELARDQFYLPSTGTLWQADSTIKHADDINTANISIVWHGNELLALWEGGSAHRINPETLANMGLKIWGKNLEHLPFSAHPRLDAQGNLWNFGSAPWQGKLMLYRIDKTGALAKFGILDIEARAMLHDFAITQDYVIFILPPLNWQTDQQADIYLQGFAWQAQQASKIIVVDKNDFSIIWQGETDTGFHFHIGNAYQHGKEIIIDFFQSKDDTLVNKWMYAVMRGDLQSKNISFATHRLLHINMQHHKVNVQTLSPLSAEFPTFAEHKIGQQNRFIWMLENKRDHALLHQLTMRDMQTGATQSYDYGTDIIAEEHIFVSRYNKGAQGWLIGTAFNHVKQHSLLSIFNAQHLADGPVFQATLPYVLPLGFHGHFVPLHNNVL